MTWFWGVQWTSTSTGWRVGFTLWAQLPPPSTEPKPALVGVWPDGTKVVDEDHFPDWLIEDVSTEDWPS